MDDFDDLGDAVALGTGYALYRHGQDALAARIERAIERAVAEIDLGAVASSAPTIRHEHVGPVDLRFQVNREWEDLVGQERATAQLKAFVGSAGVRKGRIPHLLLSSDVPGMGRRTLVRVAAAEAGVRLVELSAPFGVDTLAAAVGQLSNYDILFIDDLELASQLGGPGATTLARLLDHETLRSTDGMQQLVPEIAIVGSTTALTELPGAIAGRFAARLHLDPYSYTELVSLVMFQAHRRRAAEVISNDLAVDLAEQALTPREVDELVVLARDLSLSLGRDVGADEVVNLRG